MSSWSLESLAWWNTAAQIATGVLTALLAVAATITWLTGSELDTRRRVSEAALRRQTDDLRERLRPREIPTDKRQLLVETLRRTTGNVRVRYAGDAEVKAFAQRLAGAIKEAGWEVREEGVMSFGPLVGLVIDVRDAEAPPESAALLQLALEPVFGPIPIRSRKNIEGDVIHLLVGNKPAE